MPARPADRYHPAPDLGLIATFFNPAGYRTKRVNYDRFRAPLDDAGLRLVVVECGFGDATFDLPAGEGVFHVRGRDVMWQKERLLNLALARLPAGCTKVAWLDADLLFENPGWAAETAPRWTAGRSSSRSTGRSGWPAGRWPRTPGPPPIPGSVPSISDPLTSFSRVTSPGTGTPGSPGRPAGRCWPTGCTTPASPAAATT